MGIEVIHQLFQKSDASGSKSTILKPLTWLISVLISAEIVLSYSKANTIILIFIAVLISLVFIVFMFAFIFCLFKNPDALRSETFSIQKMAIEKGVFGDSNSGMFLSNEQSDLLKMSQSSTVEKGEQK